MKTTSQLTELKNQWLAQWPTALECWSRFTKLKEPVWCYTDADAKREGLTQSFAMIRLDDHTVVVNLKAIHESQVADFALEILAHEIGHHVYAPADLTDHGRMIARMRWGLPTKEHLAGLVSNLYTDLLINDRLQRSNGLRMAQVYLTLGGSNDRLWQLYMRIYEILWSQRRYSLAGEFADEKLEGDAQLGARLIRHYARDWLDGSGKFAALCLPYLLDDKSTEANWVKRWRDMESVGQGGFPSGLVEVEDGEISGAIHPAYDPELSGLSEGEVGDEPGKDRVGGGGLAPNAVGNQPGQAREPFQFGEILRALGIKLDDHELAVRYYRERAVPYLIPFPQEKKPQATDPLPEGLETWDMGMPLNEVDWLESVTRSPRIVPGLTTVQRVWGESPGHEPEKEPLDLDLYVDCSGSMPNPQRNTSFLTLAGTIIALSALRTGARVQATLWSGARQFITTEGFVRDENAILRILTGYLGGATAFPIHILRDTYTNRRPSDRPVHILNISDDGITTMFDKDEKGNSGWDISEMALKNARGGGTMVLNLWQAWEKNADLVRAKGQGWQIYVIKDWADLLKFAREFSQLKYGEKS